MNKCVADNSSNKSLEYVVLPSANVIASKEREILDSSLPKKYFKLPPAFPEIVNDSSFEQPYNDLNSKLTKLDGKTIFLTLEHSANAFSANVLTVLLEII